MTEHWTMRAACRGSDPRLFFPDTGCASWEDTAKAICTRCPVALTCLALALEEGVTGIWGGLNDEERRARTPGQVRTNLVRAQRRREVATLTDRGFSAHDISEQLAVSQREVVRLRRELRQQAIA